MQLRFLLTHGMANLLNGLNLLLLRKWLFHTKPSTLMWGAAAISETQLRNEPKTAKPHHSDGGQDVSPVNHSTCLAFLHPGRHFGDEIEGCSCKFHINIKVVKLEMNRV